MSNTNGTLCPKCHTPLRGGGWDWNGPKGICPNCGYSEPNEGLEVLTLEEIQQIPPEQKLCPKTGQNGCDLHFIREASTTYVMCYGHNAKQALPTTQSATRAA